MAAQQIKIFKGLESDIPTLEAEINQWLSNSPHKILNIFGNIAPQSPVQASSGTSGSGNYLSQSPSCPSDLVIIVTYEKAE